MPDLEPFSADIESFSKLTSDIVNKILGISESFLEENFEIGAHDQSSVFVVMFVLSPSEVNSATKE